MAHNQLLYLVHRLPFPPNRGDRIRSYHFLRYLAERYDVSLATLADEPVSAATRRELDRLCVQVAIEPVTRSRWLRAAGSLACGHTATEGLFRSPALGRTVRQWASSTQFDAALVFCSSMVQYLDCPELADVPAVVDLVDVDSQKWFDYAARTFGLKRLLFNLEGRRLRRLEQSLPHRASAITLVSEAEADLYRGFCPNDRTHAITNGVDLNYYQPAPGTERPGRCIFVGVMDYPPNVEGVVWFCEHVWPQIIASHPDATFAIVGRNPTSAVLRLARISGVEVIGAVPDVRPHLAEAQIAVIPLLTARGVQNKVLEAMAMAKPVIASSPALEGLTARPSEHLIVPTSPATWRSSIESLLADGEACRRLGTRARQFVDLRHSWEDTLTALDNTLFLAPRTAMSKGQRPLELYVER